MKSNKEVKLYSIPKIVLFSIIFCALSALLVFMVVLLKSYCLSTKLLANQQIAQASQGPNYGLINQDCNLYKTSQMQDSSAKNIILTLPKSYYCEILKDGTDSLQVRYNGMTGFCDSSCITKTSEIKGELYQSTKLSTTSTSSTYLRQEPNTTSEKIAIISPSSPLNFIGKITGETPTDGITNNWYLVSFDLGPTTTHLGYIYGERCVLDKPLTEQQLIKEEELLNPSSSSATQTSDSVSTQTQTEPALDLSPAVKWVLVSIFLAIALVIFLLLILAPNPNKDIKTDKPKPKKVWITHKENSNETLTPHSKTPKENKKQLLLFPFSARSSPEFGEFLETSDLHQPANKNIGNTQIIKPKTSHSLKSEQNMINLLSPTTKKALELPSSTLPPSLSKYFKAEKHSLTEEDLL